MLDQLFESLLDQMIGHRLHLHCLPTGMHPSDAFKTGLGMSVMPGNMGKVFLSGLEQPPQLNPFRSWSCNGAETGCAG